MKIKSEWIDQALDTLGLAEGIVQDYQLETWNQPVCPFDNLRQQAQKLRAEFRFNVDHDDETDVVLEKHDPNHIPSSIIDSLARTMIDHSRNFPRFDYTEWAYANYLKDKTILITGGADDFVSEWENDEVWVRINSHVLRQFGPCDVLYHTCVAEPNIGPELVEHIAHDGFAFLNLCDSGYEIGRWPAPIFIDFLIELRDRYPQVEIGHFASGTWMEKNPYGPQYEWLNDLHKKYDAKFFTGSIALAHILRFQPRAIHVQGMSLFVEKTGGSRAGKVESHEVEGNVRFMEDCLKDPRVTFSPLLMAALEKYGDSSNR